MIFGRGVTMPDISVVSQQCPRNANYIYTVAYPGILFGAGGFNKFS